MNKPKENFTQVPNYFFDELMADLTPVEFKLLMLIARKTLGFHKNLDKISISQFEKITGLTINTVRRGLKSLIDNNLIVMHSKGTGSLISSYSIKTDRKMTSNGGSKNDPDLILIRSNSSVMGDHLTNSRGSKGDPTKELLQKKLQNKQKNKIKSEIQNINYNSDEFKTVIRKALPEFTPGSQQSVLDFLSGKINRTEKIDRLVEIVRNRTGTNFKYQGLG